MNSEEFENVWMDNEITSRHLLLEIGNGRYLTSLSEGRTEDLGEELGIKIEWDDEPAYAVSGYMYQSSDFKLNVISIG